MSTEREPALPADGLTVPRGGDQQQELNELLWTLEICRRALPWDAHPEHVARLRRIERLVRWSLERR